MKQALHRYKITELINLAESKNTKHFYQYINNNAECKSSSIHRLISKNGTEETTYFDKAMLLNASFTTNFTQASQTTFSP